METSLVKMDTDDALFYSGVIQKEDLAVVAIGDRTNNTLYIFNGETLTQCCYKKKCKSGDALFEKFIHSIGKLAKKPKESKYFTGEKKVGWELDDLLLRDKIEDLKKEIQ